MKGASITILGGYGYNYSISQKAAATCGNLEEQYPATIDSHEQDILLLYGRVHTMDTARKLRHNVETGDTDLFAAVSGRRGFNATDPRDMIFAYAGFASSDAQNQLQIVYSESIDHIYTNFALDYLHKDSNLRLLFHTNELDQGLPTLQTPTWVPDWRRQCLSYVHALPDMHLGYYWPFWNFGKTLEQQIKFKSCLKDPPTLLILGCRAENIVCYSNPLSLARISAENKVKFARNIDSIRRLLKPFLHSTGKEVMFEFDCETYQELYDPMYNAWHNFIIDSNILPPLDKSERRIRGQNPQSLLNVKDCIVDFLAASFEVLSDRRAVEGKCLARLSSGVLALVPSTVHLGDIVIHSSGHIREPFLFRPCRRPPKSGKAAAIRSEISQKLDVSNVGKLSIKHCTFVGSIFIHGMESLEATHTERICDQEFWGTSEIPSDDGTRWPRTIYAVH